MILNFRKSDPDFKVTSNGQLLHWASGEPVRAGDMIAGKAYTFDRSLSPEISNASSTSAAPEDKTEIELRESIENLSTAWAKHINEKPLTDEQCEDISRRST